MNSEIKHMADQLKSGAKMLSEACPQCNSPLFSLKDEIFCAKCNKPVIKLKPTEEESKLIDSTVLDMVEQTILKKIQEIDSLIKIEKRNDRLIVLEEALSRWLEVLEKVRKLKKN